MQNAVDTKAYEEFLFHRLEVNIRGFFIYRIRQNHVHELDDRRLVGELGRIVQVLDIIENLEAIAHVQVGVFFAALRFIHIVYHAQNFTFAR